jgi:uncharacterized protein (UPF0332 family)
LFALFVVLRFPNHSPPIALLVQLEALNEQVHQGCYIMFKPMVQELLKIEQLCQKKLNKIKTSFFMKVE